MTLPASALDQCLESFTAADGNCVKASTQQFDSMGVMALLCQHDWAIFLANMVTTGEKQFYAYTLIAALLCEVPECWKVSLLYDVACALQWSLAKWQFMPGWLDWYRRRIGSSDDCQIKLWFSQCVDGRLYFCFYSMGWFTLMVDHSLTSCVW
ncbi:hypothetical protein BS47DRAFT_1304877 [Hydnum rufescens UP504]|uniref:Uncharacterized protein n=1 Tax=Hydnum rufescens UP504 TaxID=1448309 RepID=A0A9P6AJ07_9AGAM|nr:hypothetical protein BS47DRAFT_1304877 [Hydnum rufescens UP504]